MLALNNQLTMSSREIAELTGKRHDNVRRTIESLYDLSLISVTQSEEPTTNGGKPTKVYHFNKRDSYVVVARLSPEFTAKLVDRWQELENNIPKHALPSVKELALMVIAAEEEKEKALLLVEEKSHHIEGLESLFHSGGTITQFAKQLNGVNCNKINLWLYDNTKWLYDDNKGKVHTQGRKAGQPKPHIWRASSYARDKYITERPVNLEVQGAESFTKYEVTLLASGKKWLFKKYITGELLSCMKRNWDGKYTQEKDLYQPESKIEWLENTAL